MRVNPGYTKPGEKCGSIFPVFARHRLVWEKIKNLSVLNQLDTFGMKSHKMRAVLAVFPSNATVDAKKVGIGAIDALSKRDTDLRNGDLTGSANREEIFAFPVFFAAFQEIFSLKISENTASHKNMVCGLQVCFDVF